MKPNQKNRYNGRHNNRNSRTMIMRNTVLESSGPAGKLHGTALQLSEKYQAAAKDAVIQNDLIMAQTYLQYADHYIRLQNMAIQNEQNLRNQANANRLVEAVLPEKNDELPIVELPSDNSELPVQTEDATSEIKSEQTDCLKNQTADITQEQTATPDGIIPETISVSTTPVQEGKVKKTIRRPRLVKAKQNQSQSSEVVVS